MIYGSAVPLPVVASPVFLCCFFFFFALILSESVPPLHKVFLPRVLTVRSESTRTVLRSSLVGQMGQRKHFVRLCTDSSLIWRRGKKTLPSGQA